MRLCHKHVGLWPGDLRQGPFWGLGPHAGNTCGAVRGMSQACGGVGASTHDIAGGP